MVSTWLVPDGGYGEEDGGEKGRDRPPSDARHLVIVIVAFLVFGLLDSQSVFFLHLTEAPSKGLLRFRPGGRRQAPLSCT